MENQKIYQCKYCQKEFDNGWKLGGHIVRCKLNPNYEKISKILSKSITYKRIKVIKYCLKCKKPFEVERKINRQGIEIIYKGERKYCSDSCSKSMSTINTKNKTKIIKCSKCRKNIIVSIYAGLYTTLCLDCKKKFIYKCVICGKPIKHKTKFGACKNCFITLPEYKKQQRNMALKLIKDGKIKGWPSRNILSYPEKFFIEVLKNNDLFDKCKVNFPIQKYKLGYNGDNKYANYFLDFYFEDKKIDLEIDGNQHYYYKERQQSDNIRDNLLINYGIKVYRIKWKNPINEENKRYIKEEIDKFLLFYAGVPK